MLSALLAVGWEPEIRGWIIVIISVAVLMGSTYLILGTNLGARLGFLIAITGLAGWMMSMAIIWAVYGIGLKGPEPTWHPHEPIAIVRDGSLLDRTEIVESSSDLKGLDSVAAALISWRAKDGNLSRNLIHNVVKQLPQQTKSFRLKQRNLRLENTSQSPCTTRVVRDIQNLETRLTSWPSSTNRGTQLLKSHR